MEGAVAEIQGLVTNWVAALAALLPFGYAFSAGMVAAVNPCGFVMLPAYLSLYLGAHEATFAERSLLSRVLRALLVGISVSGGFVLLFGAVGLAVSAGGRYLMAATPWVGVLIGLALVGLGILQLAGKSIYAGAFERLAERGTDPKASTLRGFLLFGLAYGAASLGCTLPVFLVVVGSAVASAGWLAGTLQFVSYGLGLGAIVVTLTIALALFKQGVATTLRRVVPHVQQAAAVLLLLAGVYLVIYWAPSVGL
jgi:cytochrome c-type biogenesis protein